MSSAVQCDWPRVVRGAWEGWLGKRTDTTFANHCRKFLIIVPHIDLTYFWIVRCRECAILRPPTFRSPVPLCRRRFGRMSASCRRRRDSAKNKPDDALSSAQRRRVLRA
jgi:hypothetical protein